MALYFENLDDRTRRLMLDEMDYDIANNQLHISPFLSGQGQRDYANLLREALQSGNDETLAQNLREHRRILRTLPRRNPTGGYSMAATAENAAQVLAESEFNRYYIRALAGGPLQMASRSWLCTAPSLSKNHDPNQRRGWKPLSLRKNY